MGYGDIKEIGYRISPVLKDLPLKNDESITAIETYENNIYIGTSHGNLLHFHRFEDTTEYIYITSLEVNSLLITKLLCVPYIQRLLVISNRTTFAFSLPELSPCHMKRMKDVNDLQLLDNRILVLSPSKIRIIKIQDDKIMVTKEINYSGAMAGNSCRDSHFIIVANQENYDIIDLDNNRKVPLFAYKSDTEVNPIIISFDKEYLLTILSDANTSMAMFINSSGDVTRGTLTWVGEGYPINGIVIESQYVFSAFESKLVVSSLDSLEPVAEIDNHLFSISSVSQMIVEDEEVKALVDTDIQPVKLQVALNKGKEIYGIYQEHILIQLQQKLLNNEKLEVDVNEFTGAIHDYIIHMLLFTAIKSNKEEEILRILNIEKDGQLIIPPQLALYLFTNSHGSCETFSGLRSLFSELKLPANPEFLKKYIQNLKHDFLNSNLRLYFYGIATERECIDFIARDNFSEYNQLTKSIIETLTNKAKLLSVSEIFKLLVAAKCKELLHDYSIFLSNHILDNKLLENSILLILSGDLDDSDYAKTLISIVKFDKAKGFDVLKRAPKKYQNINTSIMKDLSEDGNNDQAFALLQVSVLEKAFRDDLSLRDDLLNLMAATMKSLHEDIKDQFDLLYEEFVEMNSLEKNKWPKIAWLDFLGICGKSKDLLQFVELYLKTFELGLGSDKVFDGKIFKYYQLFSARDIEGLLEFGDYSTAENLAIAKDPLPRKQFYDSPQLDLPVQSQESLLKILKFYLEKYSAGKPVESAIKHFSEQYFKFIPVLDFLNLIPDSFPLAYLLEYFNETIVELNEDYRDILIRKAVSKAEALRTRKLSKDFSK